MSTVANDARNTVLATAIRLATITSPKWASVIPAKRYSRVTCRGKCRNLSCQTKVLFVLDNGGLYLPVMNVKKLCLYCQKVIYFVLILKFTTHLNIQ